MAGRLGDFSQDDSERIRDIAAGEDYRQFENQQASQNVYGGEFAVDYDEEEVYDVQHGMQAPARLTDIPTSSTNSSRPRTVAAGYDKNRKVMTVMFRDGTLYNYYDVSEDEWLSFHNSLSKGRPHLNRGFPNAKNPNAQRTDGLFLSKMRGAADTSGLDEDSVSEYWRAARTAQTRYKSTRRRTVTHEEGYKVTYTNTVPKAAARKAGYGTKSFASQRAGFSGKNPSKNAGKAPKP